jgi:hypothetical protein
MVACEPWGWGAVLNGRRLKWLRAVTVMPAVIAVSAALVASCSFGSSQHPGPSRTLAPTQQARLERDIAARSVQAEANVVAPQVRAAFVQKGRLLLPAGSRLVIRRSTFRQVTSETAVVDAVVTGPSPGRWELLLVRQEGQWLLIGTRRLS